MLKKVCPAALVVCAGIIPTYGNPSVAYLPRPEGAETADFIKALSVSGDGRWIAGYSGDKPFTNLKLVRWDLMGSTEVIDTGEVQVLGAFISDDGQTIAGFTDSRWTAIGGAEHLTSYPNFPEFPRDIRGITSDGQKLLIRDEDGGAFLWTSSSSTQIPAPKGYDNVQALGLSSDGQVTVGVVSTNQAAAGLSLPQRAFVWRDGVGYEFPDTGSGTTFSELRAVSRDGSCAAGEAEVDGVNQLLIWTNDAGAELVGEYPFEGEASIEYNASAIADDASIVIGDVDIYEATLGVVEDSPFVWTPSTGVLPARDYLLSLGLTEVESWGVFELTGLSADGTTIIGTALVSDPTSGQAGYSAFAIRVPSPSVGTLLLGISLAAVRRNRRTD